jgi:hypothetical protein
MMCRDLCLSSLGLWILAFVGITLAEAKITQVAHDPPQPKPGQVVTVRCQIKSDVAIEAAQLLVQPVAPGKYVRRTDPKYEKNWQAIALHDDGRAGDVRAGDGIFSGQVPPELQQHRQFVRYRIAVTDRAGRTTSSHAADDPVPNYAWFCYGSVPAWSGAREPGKTPPRTFSPEFLSTIRSYQLIARNEDVTASQWDGGAHKRRFAGTFVYDGVVYDHIAFTNRGQGSAHIGGKNKWAFKFAKDHPVPLRDNWGRPYDKPWQSVDLNPGTHTPYIPVHRGISGLDEAVSFRAYQLAGVPSSATHWVQLRVIDAAEKASSKDQYEGDLWGLYLAIADIDQDLLAGQKLADGLMVSIQSGVKHLPADGSAGQPEWDKFLAGIRSNPPEEWWRKNLNLPAYYSFHALNRLIGNVDIRPDGNHGYYRGPDGRWSPIPWDNDMCFVPRHHQPGHIDAIHCLNHAAIKREYQNRAREILDLFASDTSPTGGQIGQLVADLCRVLRPAGHTVDWSQLDEAMWNAHPRFNQKGSFFVNPAYGDHFGGRWERKLATNDLAGFERYLIEFCTDSRPQKNYQPNDGNPLGYGWGYVAHEARDEEIPARPTIKLVSGNANQPRKLSASAFTSPKGHAAAGVEWRVGRHCTSGLAGWEKTKQHAYEISEHWRTPREKLTTANEVTIPAEVFQQPGVYRIRARHWDQTGRASHWSEPGVISVP